MGHRSPDGELDPDFRQLCRACERADIDAVAREVRRREAARHVDVSKVVGSDKSPLHDALWWGGQLVPELNIDDGVTTVSWRSRHPLFDEATVRREIMVRLGRSGLAGVDLDALARSLSSFLSELGQSADDVALVARRFLAGYRSVRGHVVGPLPGSVSATRIVPGALIGDEGVWCGRLAVSRDGELTPSGGFEMAPPTPALSVSLVAATARRVPASEF